MVDRNLILRKLSNLETYFEQIKGYQKISLGDYKKDWKTQRIVERTLQMMIEICIDIAGHIISDKKLRVPARYADSFSVLTESEIIEKDLFQSLTKMAKFRNVVVHDYDRVDEGIVIGILRNNLDDFIKFKDAIVAFLRSESS